MSSSRVLLELYLALDFAGIGLFRFMIDIEDIIAASNDDADNIDINAVDAAIAAYQRPSPGGDITSKAAEFVVSPIVAYREYNGLSVTDLCNQVWCEHQLALKLSLGERLSEDAATILARGTARHAELEAELGHAVVAIETATREEAFAVRFTNALSGLDELSKTGTTRELFVVGKAHGVWIFGVIDQISLRRDATDSVPPSVDESVVDLSVLECDASDVEARMLRERRQISSFAREIHRTPTKREHKHDGGERRAASRHNNGYILSDNKTRKNKSLPSIPQKRTSRFQLQMYWRLYASLCQQDGAPTTSPSSADNDFVSTAFTVDEFLADFCLSGDTDFTPLFIVQLDEMGLSGRNLRQLVSMYLFIFETFPRPLRTLQVHYEHQSSNAVIGVDHFTVDSFSLNIELSFYLQYWTGQRASEPCLTQEQWKCRFCEYRPECVHTTFKAKADDARPNADTQTLTLTAAVSASTLPSNNVAVTVNQSASASERGAINALKRNLSALVDESTKSAEQPHTAQRTRSVRLKRINMTTAVHVNQAEQNVKPTEQHTIIDAAVESESTAAV